MVKPLLLHISLATSLAVYVQIVGQKSLKIFLAQNPEPNVPFWGANLAVSAQRMGQQSLKLVVESQALKMAC